MLYASFRRRDEIYGWDLRGSTVTPLQTFSCDNGSRLETNQKMKFDIDLGGNLMGVGDQVSLCKSSEHLLAKTSSGIER
jgi:telomerase Cajal body protein 1